MNRRIQTCYLLSEQEKMLLQDAAKEPEPARPQLRVSAGLQPGSQPEKPAVQTLILPNPAPVPPQTEIPAAPAVLKPAAEIAEAAEKPAESAPKVTAPPQQTALQRDEKPREKSFTLAKLIAACCVLIIILYNTGALNEQVAGIIMFGLINGGILCSWVKHIPARIVVCAVYIMVLFMHYYAYEQNDFNKPAMPAEMIFTAVTIFPMMASLFGSVFRDRNRKIIGKAVYSVLLIGASVLTGYSAGLMAVQIVCLAAILAAAGNIIRLLLGH